MAAANSLRPPKALGQSTADKSTPISVIYEAVAATNATLWLIKDARLFEKYGPNANVIHARGAVPVQALVSNSVEFGAFGGPSAVAAVLAGSDLVFIAAKGNFAVMSIWVGKDSSIKTIADLKGKTLGVTRAGSESHTIARLTLRSAGIADNEVKYLHHPGLPGSLYFTRSGSGRCELWLTAASGISRAGRSVIAENSVPPRSHRGAAQLSPEPATPRSILYGRTSRASSLRKKNPSSSSLRSQNA